MQSRRSGGASNAPFTVKVRSKYSSNQALMYAAQSRSGKLIFTTPNQMSMNDKVKGDDFAPKKCIKIDRGENKDGYSSEGGSQYSSS